MTCINCGTECDSQFCPNCGQKNPPRKITLGHLYHDFQSRIYGFDGMFPRTLRDLTLRPGLATRKFIEGNRVQYYGPVGYFFLMVTVFLLWMGLLDVDVVQFLKASSKSSFLPEQKEVRGQAEIMKAVFQFVSDNLKVIAFVVIPLQALSARYIFFRGRAYNFLEHSVLPFYVQGHLYWVSIVSVLYYKTFGNFLPNWLTLGIALFYFSFAYANLFGDQAKVKTFFKGLGVNLAAQFLLVLIVVSIFLLIILLNPDILETIRPSNSH